MSAHRNALVGLAGVLAAVAVYHLLFFARFFPLQEGWFQAYAHWIAAGRVPYRDFYLFLQPGYPWLITALTRMFGDDFLGFRVFGLAERMMLSAVLYAFLLRRFRVTSSLLATVLVVAVYSTVTSDTVYSYLQTAFLLALVGAYLAMRSLDGKSRRAVCATAASAGLCLGAAFLVKQTTGAVVWFAVVLCIGLVGHRLHDRLLLRRLGWLTGGFLVLPLATFAYLASERALGPYVEQVWVRGPSSKGSLGDVLLGFAPRAFVPAYLLSYAAIVSLGALWWWITWRYGRAGGLRRWRELVATIVVILLVYGHWVLPERYVGLTAAIAGASALGALLWWQYERLRVTVSVSPSPLRTRETAVITLLSAVLIAALVAPSFDWRRMWLMWTSLHFYVAKLALVHWSFFTLVPLAVALAWLAWRDARRYGGLLLMAGTALAVVYSNALSYKVEETSALPGLALVFCLVYEARVLGRRFLNTALVLCVVVCLSLCVAQKLAWPYQWWGWREAAVAHATTVSQQPDLVGMRLSPLTRDTVDAVTRLIGQNTKPGEWGYTFPNIPLFYVLSGEYPRTFALVHYWDVCPDDVARRDARTLRDDPPAVIVELRFYPEVWVVHEQAFRRGKPSGQRAIQAAIDGLVDGGNYERRLEVPTPSGDSTLIVWVRARRGAGSTCGRSGGAERAAANSVGVRSPAVGDNVMRERR